jgi:hypothetical protein
MVLTKRAFGMKTAGFSWLLLLSCALIGGVTLGVAPASAGLLNDMWGSDSKPDNAAPAPDDGKPKGLFNRMWGSDDSQPAAPAAQPPLASQPPAQTDPARPSKRGTQATPVSTPPVAAEPPIQPSGEAIKLPGSEEPNALGRAMNSAGLTGEPGPSKIDYSERPKLVVPAQRDLPPPREGGERQPTLHPDQRALINPPPEYLQKMRGPDGQVSGVREGDIPKEKKFFGLF